MGSYIASIIIRGVALIALILYRFFSGLPMRGKKARRGNSTFLHGATKPRPGRKLKRWDRKPEIHRGLIRCAYLFPPLLLAVVTVINWTDALVLVAVSSPVWGLLAARKLRLVFFVPYTSATDGVRTQHWRLKREYARLFRKHPVPGLIGPSYPRVDPDLPSEIREAILRDVNMNLTGGDLPVSRIERVSRRRKIEQ